MEPRTTEIHVRVELDEQSHPERMSWSATDAPFEGEKECKSMLLSIWDPEEMAALRIDLWTSEMRVDEMDRMVYQTLITLSDSYRRATGNERGAEDIMKFGKEFGDKAGITQPKA